MQHAPRLRLIALAGAVAVAVAVPLAAATAGPADTFMSGTRGERAVKQSKTDKAGKSARPGADGGSGEASSALADLDLPLVPQGGRTTRCGPELASSQGIEAQTCVLAERGLTWARTYYRNPTGEPLRAVLTLLRPDGSTVQVHCEVAAADVPGMCETPTGATVGKDLPYGAVAEIADAAGERLLLRSGGNSTPKSPG